MFPAEAGSPSCSVAGKSTGPEHCRFGFTACLDRVFICILKVFLAGLVARTGYVFMLS